MPSARLTALSGKQLAAKSGADAGVGIRVVPAQTRFSLRLDAADAQVSEWPPVSGSIVRLNTFTGSGDLICARLGPNEWFLAGPDGESDAHRGADRCHAGRTATTPLWMSAIAMLESRCQAAMRRTFSTAVARST